MRTVVYPFDARKNADRGPRRSSRSAKWKWRWRRFAVHPYCGICKERIEMFHQTSIDHIVPISKGKIPKSDRSNWQLAHVTCNNQKGSKSEVTLKDPS